MEIASEVITDDRIENFEQGLSGWDLFKHHTVDINYSLDSKIVKAGKWSMKIDFTFHDPNNMFVAFLVKDLGKSQDWSQFDSIGLWTYIPEKAGDLRDLSVMLYENDGSAYIAQDVRNLRDTGWEYASVPFSKFIYTSGGIFKNKESKPDRHKIKKISVGIYQPVAFEDKKFTVYVDDFRLLKKEVRDGEERSGRDNNRKTRPGQTSAAVDGFDSDLGGWSKNIAPTITLDYSIDDSVIKQNMKSLKMHYRFKKKEPFWGFLDKDLGSTRNWKSFDAISFWSYVPKAADDLVSLSAMIYEEDGGSYIAQHVRSLKTMGWEEVIVPFSKFYPAGEQSKAKNDTINPERIRKVSVGIWQPDNFSDKDFVLYVNNIKAIKAPEPSSGRSAGPVVRTSELQKYEPPDGQVYHGVAAFAAPMGGWGANRSDWEKQIDVKQISEYEDASGRPVALVTFFWFLDWDFPEKICQSINALGKIPHLTVISGGVKTSDIVKGKWDRKISEWARAAKDYGKPVFFRFFHEMNGNWNIYSQAKNPEETQESYVHAWRRVANTFRKTGANNIIWVWAPTAVDVGKFHWSGYYPGDEYVDWVGVSVYSFLGSGDPEPQIMDIYNDYAARKPIIIAESGAGDADNNPKRYSPGQRYFDNPEKWIDRYFDTLEKKAPRVKAFVWFNIDRERVWRIQESPAKIKVFNKRLSNKRYGAGFKE